MSEMIERVAKAIAAQELGRDWNWWVDEARAAIEAMREPTEAMRAAVEGDANIQNGLDDCNKHDIPYDAWRLMIDAALTPPETSS